MASNQSNSNEMSVIINQNNNSKGEMHEINSFIFLDLETSHLESSDQPTIIEISLVAVHRTGLLHPDVLSSVERAKPGDSSGRGDWNGQLDLGKLVLPRVVDKMTLCLDPRKHTSDATFRLTKLDNLNLAESKKLPFDEGVVGMLGLFLKRQASPVCLVAHNGNKFDFRLLRTELWRLEAEGKFSEIFCVDSLEAFRADFVTKDTAGDEASIKVAPSTQKSGNQSEIIPIKMSKIEDTLASNLKIGCESMLLDMPHNTIELDGTSTVHGTCHFEKAKAGQAAQSINSLLSTTNGTCVPSPPLSTISHISKDISPRRSPPPPPTKTYDPNRYAYVRAKYNTPKISYSLINIFKRTFGREPPNSHAAEDDIDSLIKVLLPRVQEFVGWSDKNKTEFNKVDLYYRPRKPKRKLVF